MTLRFLFKTKGLVLSIRVFNFLQKKLIFNALIIVRCSGFVRGLSSMEDLKKNLDLKKIEQKILRLYSQGKKRTASNLAVKHIRDGAVFTDKNLLTKIVEPYGHTVAHQMAFQGVNFKDISILKLTGEDRFGDYGKGKNILGHNGCSVAFVLAGKGYFFEDKSIQKLGSEKNVMSVAHAMAKKGYKFTDKDILSLKDSMGLSVAHEMARHGHEFEDKEILELKSIHGLSVRDFQNKTT